MRYDGNKKQILNNITGYAKPGELLAIMGASGCGKTSLLNILAQRVGVSPGATFLGDVRANNRVVKEQDFGKIGSFVQQSDILLETMTPKEALRFAAKLRTTLNDAEIEERVEILLKRLGLYHCQNTQLGGMSFKGVSGSERKKTCIGYELITDPKVLLLDEPTSGLDSLTSNKIIKILRKEAARGLTVVSTIHLPSSETFHLFDRLVLMHDGY